MDPVNSTTGNADEIDMRHMVIKNLDTGEEFVIGENDPDFEFDTFEIGGKKGAEVVGTAEVPNASSQAQIPTQRFKWIRSLFQYLYGQSKENIEEKIAQEASKENSPGVSQKTPFTKLSSFKIRKELGRGAFGRVLLAEAKTDGKLYALKIISKKNMRTSDRRQAKAERDILHAMTLKSPHPFTSGLKFAFQSENNLYLGMDYIPGGNLRELIKKFKYLPEDWVQFYAAELILAISHLHSLNVLYRDIKPHNVMIDARGHLILIDFGLSKQEISHPRGALSLVGTPDYSAPEVLRTGVQQIEAHNREKALRANGKKKKAKKLADDFTAAVDAQMANIGYGKAADWWSLGIMIYEMLGGKPTFRGADLRETYQRILYSKLEFVPEERFSPSAKKLLEGLINRDPSLRLGAWENPPKDIMGSAFFEKIEWDGIYERRSDGPLIPELPSFLNNRKNRLLSSTSGKEPSASTDTEAVKKLNFTPAPWHRVTPDEGKDAPVPLPAPQPVANEEEEDDEDDDDDDDDDYNQEIAMRDSVFIFSKDNAANQLPDWSYIDEAVLMEYITQETMKQNGGKEKEKKDTAKKESSKSSHESNVPAPTTVTAEEGAAAAVSVPVETVSSDASNTPQDQQAIAEPAGATEIVADVPPSSTVESEPTANAAEPETVAAASVDEATVSVESATPSPLPVDVDTATTDDPQTTTEVPVSIESLSVKVEETN